MPEDLIFSRQKPSHCSPEQAATVLFEGQQQRENSPAVRRLVFKKKIITHIYVQCCVCLCCLQTQTPCLTRESHGFIGNFWNSIEPYYSQYAVYCAMYMYILQIFCMPN